MSCKVKHETALLNSRDFLITQGAIDKVSNIKSLDKFTEANTQLFEDALNAYGVQGNLWNEKNGRAVPNHSILKSIDEKRKELGLYDKKEAGQIGIINLKNSSLLNNPEAQILDGQKVLQSIIDNAVWESDIELAKVFLKNYDNLGKGFRIGIVPDNEAMPPVAHYDPSYNEILINEKVSFDNISTDSTTIVLHEFVHAFTSTELYLNKNSQFSKSINELFQFVLQQDVIMDYMDNEANNNGLTSVNYFATNEHEFLAEALSNKKFQEVLGGIKYKKNTSVFEEFLNALYDFFGIDYSQTILQKILEEFSLLLDAQSKNIDVFNYLDSEGVSYFEYEDYSQQDAVAERESIKEGNIDSDLLSLDTFNEAFPEFSYATDFEKQMIIDSIKEGDISINCKL